MTGPHTAASSRSRSGSSRATALRSPRKKSIHTEKWPAADLSKIETEAVKIGIQVNGKVRAELEVGAGESEEEVVKKALGFADIQKWIEGKKILKTVFVKGRLVNFVAQ